MNTLTKVVIGLGALAVVGTLLSRPADAASGKPKGVYYDHGGQVVLDGIWGEDWGNFFFKNEAVIDKYVDQGYKITGLTTNRGGMYISLSNV